MQGDRNAPVSPTDAERVVLGWLVDRYARPTRSGRRYGFGGACLAEMYEARWREADSSSQWRAPIRERSAWRRTGGVILHRLYDKGWLTREWRADDDAPTYHLKDDAVWLVQGPPPCSACLADLEPYPGRPREMVCFNGECERHGETQVLLPDATKP